MVLRSIAHHPGAIPFEDFERYFLYLLEQVRGGRNRFQKMHRCVPLDLACPPRRRRRVSTIYLALLLLEEVKLNLSSIRVSYVAPGPARPCPVPPLSSFVLFRARGDVSVECTARFFRVFRGWAFVVHTPVVFDYHRGGSDNNPPRRRFVFIVWTFSHALLPPAAHPRPVPAFDGEIKPSCVTMSCFC